MQVSHIKSKCRKRCLDGFRVASVLLGGQLFAVFIPRCRFIARSRAYDSRISWVVNNTAESFARSRGVHLINKHGVLSVVEQIVRGLPASQRARIARTRGQRQRIADRVIAALVPASGEFVVEADAVRAAQRALPSPSPRICQWCGDVERPMTIVKWYGRRVCYRKACMRKELTEKRRPSLCRRRLLRELIHEQLMSLKLWSNDRLTLSQLRRVGSTLRTLLPTS